MLKTLALLLIFAAPALADSIPPPVASISFAGAGVIGAFNSSSSYFFRSTNDWPNFCPSDCVIMEVEKGVFTGYSSTNFAQVWGGTAGMFGHLGKVSFNPQTDVLSGVFGGKEDTYFPGTQFPPAWYIVRGTFSENLGTGAGSLNLTSETYIGLTAVPEPGTLIMLGTGLCAIAGMVRQFKRRPSAEWR